MTPSLAEPDLRRRDGFRHEAFVYHADAEFVDRITTFALDGLERDEAVIVAEPPNRLEQVRDALADSAAEVDFFDLSEAGINPARVIGFWQRCLDQSRGRPVRGVGEAAWPGRTTAEVAQCQMTEMLLNRAFAEGPGWHLLCPFDSTHYEPELVTTVVQSHPSGVLGAVAVDAPAEEHDDRRLAQLFAAPLEAPPLGAQSVRYDSSQVGVVRETVRRFATACGLAAQRCEELVLCSSEAATNSVRYGGGSGRLLMWTEDDAVLLQFEDNGHVADPLTGLRIPDPDREGGRGLYLVNQLCDLVQLRSRAGGTELRLTTWR